MWNQQRSLVLSKVMTIALLVVVLGISVLSPVLVRWLIRYSVNAKAEYTGFFQATLVLGCSLGTLLLANLYALLRNIGKDLVFVTENVRYLRIISWVCIAGCVISLVSSLYYLPWLIVCIPAGFMALIVRVVKNIMAQAIQLKEENDYTI